MEEALIIDIVLPWVNGNDPWHQQRRSAYLADPEAACQDDVAAPTRYADCGELDCCIASIRKFAPWVRKIWLVTDHQVPDSVPLQDGQTVPVEIIDHSLLFRGYENFLPTFNSRSLEALLWRIPGLSEHFLLMNDDFFLAAPVQPKDFFDRERTISYTDWYPTWLARFLRAIKPKKQGHKPIGFKDSMLNALDLLGGGHRFIYLSHTPRALKRSFYETYYGVSGDAPGRVARQEEVLLKNIRHRFRHPEQFNSQELFYLQEAKEGRLIQKAPDTYALYLKPRRERHYIDRKLVAFDAARKALFGCVNSLDQASPEDRKKVMDWLRKKTGAAGS